MKVQEPEAGGICESLAGRDKGRLYLIAGIEGDVLLLCDGKYRLLKDPKRKNRKHVRLLPAFRKDIAERIAQGKDENSQIRAALAALQKGRRDGAGR